MKEKYNGISVKLGRNKSIKDELGNESIIQNINVYYQGKPIIDQDDSMENMTVQIFPDINEAIVGNIFLPEGYRGKKLTPKIYQAVADELKLPLVNSLDHKDRLGKFYNQSESGSWIWKKRKFFTPDNLKEDSLEKRLHLFFGVAFLLASFISIPFSLNGFAISNISFKPNIFPAILFFTAILNIYLGVKLK